MSMRKLPLSAMFLLVFTSAAFAWEMDLIWDKLGPSDSCRFGLSVSGAGDVNGDGYDDFLVGAPGMYVPPRLYLFYGGNPPDTIADKVFDVGGWGCRGGYDINGDSYSDIFTWFYNKLWIFYGGPDMDTIPEFEITFPPDYLISFRPWRFTVGGELNADRYPDFALEGGPSIGTSHKFIYLFFSGPDMDTLPDMVWGPEDLPETRYMGSIDLNGDFNNDGYSDLIFSNYSNMGTPVDSEVVGYLYLFTGGVYMSREPSMVISEYDYNINDYARYIGDINRDNYDDIAIAEEYRALVFCGNSLIRSFNCNAISSPNYGSLRVGDLNRDGYNDFVSIHPRVQYCVHLWRGSLNSTFSSTDFCTPQLGQGTPFAYAGDVNGDGCGDLVIGGSTEGLRGKAQLWAGRPGGVPGIEDNQELPTEFEVVSIYPNPFNESFNISYYLPNTGKVSFKLYNILGRLVKDLKDRKEVKGYHTKAFSLPAGSSSGLYFLVVSFGKERIVKRVIHLK